MRVAALYDIHGNVPALEAVLAEADADLFLVGGDIVGGASPGDTLERLRELGDRVGWVRGNLERMLTELPPPGTPGGPPPGLLEETAALLSREQLEFLYRLPEREVLEVKGLGEVLFVHATPQSDLDIVTYLAPDERVGAVFGEVEQAVVVCGHTHAQFDRTIGRVRVVNAGSVGSPYEDEPGAYWALLGPDVDLRRTDFPGAEPPEAGREEAATYFETLVGG